MTRKEKELKLIESFGLKVGDKVPYINNLGGHTGKRYSTIVEYEDRLMLDKGYMECIIEDLVEIGYGNDKYLIGPYCHRKPWIYSCKDRKWRARKILKILGLKVGDHIYHRSLLTDRGVIEEDTCDIILRSKAENGVIWGTPLWTFIRDNDWEVIKE